MPESATLSILRSALAGRYRVEREIGAGGMATVYLAQEERYDRRVAIKVLRPELAMAVSAERFLREIKITATLQHPHILPLYDSGDAGGLVYYVMPYVDGESLRARLNRIKQLPLRDALEIARSVAGALDYAHRRGVIHRDIKPENILLAGDARDNVNGLQALVADFGVAVAIESAGGQRLTNTGLAVGTPAYMSPEQAAAERQLGPESDVYALGVVLYEMLAGEPPFTGPTAQAVVAKLMQEKPVSLRLRRSTVPPHVDAAVLTSLEKTPADRFPSAERFADALEWAEDTRATPRPSELIAPVRGRAALLPWSLACVLAILVGVLGMRNLHALASPDGGDRGATHLAIILPEGTIAANWLGGVAIGAHSRIVAFVAADASGQKDLYLKRLDEPNVSVVPGTTDAVYPVFSPDGQWLAFFSRGTLKKVLLASGSVTTIAENLPFGSNAQWGSDGFIVFGGPNAGRVGIARISENGGAPVPMTTLDTLRGETDHIGPQLLPGGRLLMYTARGNGEAGPFSRVMIRSVGSGPARVLVEGAGLARYLADGRLVYQKETGLYVASLNLSTFALSNERRLVSGVAPMNVGFHGAAWAVSDEILAYGSTAGVDRSLVWVDRDGHGQTLPVPPRPFLGLTISPDGRRVVLAIAEARSDAWIYDLAQDVLTQTSTDGLTYGALWTPDGQRITTWGATRDGSAVFSRRPDGTGKPELLLRNVFWPTAWTKDARGLVVMTNTGDISVADLQHGGALVPLVHTPARELGGRLSPDERWLAYFSDATGTFELYVTRFPQGDSTWRVSRTGAREAVWSSDGRELFFRSANGRQVLSVTINPGAQFSFAPPRLLFQGDYFSQGGPGLVNYDVSRDGKRFLMLQRSGTGAGHLNVVQSWSRMIVAPGRD